MKHLWAHVNRFLLKCDHDLECLNCGTTVKYEQLDAKEIIEGRCRPRLDRDLGKQYGL